MRSLAALVIKGRATTAAIVLLMSATVAGTAGCASVRSGLGTSSSVCFRAIPVGKTAVQAKSSTFVGVRSASEKDIEKFGSTHDLLVAEMIKRNGGKLKGLCLIAFHGSFDPTSVHELLGPVPPVGHRAYAVVVVSEPSNKLLATLIRSKEPISFTHYVVGG
jgi:hypothetical protein